MGKGAKAWGYIKHVESTYPTANTIKKGFLALGISHDITSFIVISGKPTD